MIQGTNYTQYAFVNGKVRAREARLLTKTMVDRLIAGTLSSFTTILSDTPYVSYDNIEAGFNEEEKSIKGFFNLYCFTPEVIDLMNWPEQIHNLKVKLKGGPDKLLYDQGIDEVEEWQEVQDEVARYAVDKDPFLVSTNLDKILCKYLHTRAQFAPFFAQYYSLFFDLENIRSFFRARQFEHSREIFKQVYIPYGNLSFDRFKNIFDVNYEQVSKEFSTTPYYTVVEKGAVYLQEHHSFLRLERLCEEVKLNFLRQARRMVFGVEPLFTYYHFKMSEIKKLRQVYQAKRNDISPENLKESIPDVW
jgi:V/A-type H+-transporting ATPase subunit C